MEAIKVKLGKLKINKDNPRTITKEKMDKLVNSILVFPKMLEIRPIVVDGNMTALGGNQRTEALKRISKMSDDYIQEKLSGISDYHRLTKEEQDALIKFWKDWMKSKEVPVINADNMTEEEKKQFIIKDNNSFGEWDFAELQEKWDTSTLEDWGIDFPAEWYSPEKENKEVEEDDFTEEDAAKAETRVKAGEIWQLGEHRLMCGDSTKKEDVERLMNGEKADMVFTDPPYNCNYGNIKHPKFKVREIKNDNMDKIHFRAFCEGFIEQIKNNCIGCVYMCAGQGEDGRTMFVVADEILHNSTTIIWNKDQFTLGRGKYQNKYEPIWFGWVESGKGFTDDRTLTNVWDIPRPKKSELHPTMKPVLLVTTALRHNPSSKSVLDLFGGSGTTLIACEQLNRKCRMMELSEHYASVIIERYIKFKGSAEDVFRLNLDGTKTYYNELYHGM